MKCDNAQPLFDSLLDGVLDARATALVLDHLKSCEQCQFEWSHHESLRTRFLIARKTPEPTESFRTELSAKLKQEERALQSASGIRFAKRVTMIAAAALIIGLFLGPIFHDKYVSSPTISPTTIDTLVADSVADRAVESVASRSELGRMAGYDIRYIKLPHWQMTRAAVYRKASTSMPLVRFDFEKTIGFGDAQQLRCYQGLQGSIRPAPGWSSRNIRGKQVFAGTLKSCQFALWSQNGRDYLLITPLPMDQLQDIVSNA